jgi:hypothetical protein
MILAGAAAHARRRDAILERHQEETMTSLMARDREEAKKKGIWALGAAGGAGLLLTLGFPILGTAAGAGAVYLGYKWFMFRAKRGMRF